MRRRPFTAVLHEVFRASLVAPIGLGCVACSSDGEATPSAIVDAGTDGHQIARGEAGDEASPSAIIDAGTDAADALTDAIVIDAAACSTPPWDGGGTIISGSSTDAACIMYTLPVTGNPAECGLGECPFNAAALCQALCHQGVGACGVQTAGSGLSGSNDVFCLAYPCLTFPGGGCCGRRPQGLTLEAASGTNRVGLWFAELAAREEASVAAFEILAEELEAHGAPKRLVAAAKRAARDERSHARIMTAFAMRYGGTPRRPRVERGPVRSLEEIAVENATEGCVRETFGALVGMWQARFAGDPQVRKAMRGVARDESQHAALSWEVARWIEPMLGTDARARLATAKGDAICQFEAELLGEPAPDVVRVAGIPSAHEARRLFERARAMLWTGDEAEKAA